MATVPYRFGSATAYDKLFPPQIDANFQSIFKNGIPWADVRAWGATGDGVTDDTTTFTNAIAALATYGGGIVFLPPGIYQIPNGISIGGASTPNITIQGAGRSASYLRATGADVVTVSVGTNGQCWLKDLSVFGKGYPSPVDTGTFGATANVVEFAASGGGMQNVQILGGYFPLNVTAIDAVFLNVETGYGYGGANTYVNGASWFYRCKWDHSTTAVVNTTALPIPARANTTVYAAGDSVVVSSYVLTCQTGGTSGGSAPTLLNYGRDITDGTVTWRLGAPQTFSGLYIDSSAGENHFHMCDLTGLYSQSLTQAGGSLTYTVFSDGVLSSPVAVNSGKLFALHHCELGDDIGVDTGYSGITHISNNYGVTSTIDIDIGIGANVNDFLITANYLGGGTITVVAGTSDHYVISGNVRTTVTDGGTGVNKSVTGNVA